MNKYLSKIGLMLLFILLVPSCSDRKITNILNVGNIDRENPSDTINTSGDEYSVYQRTNLSDCVETYGKEFNEESVSKVFTHNNFFYNLYDSLYIRDNKVALDNLTRSVQSVQFLTHTSGLVSLSHNGDSIFNTRLNLPFNKQVGRTDIFYFQLKESNKLEFNVLPEGINSMFWDSHPWAIQDTNCNLFMVWSSDRDNPYSTTQNLKGETIAGGNTDIYYAFLSDGVWTQARKIDTTEVLNTPKNEISPFLICNDAPKLFYASNNGGNNYDIYRVDLNVDFNNKVVTIIQTPERLAQNLDTSMTTPVINTPFDEKHPYIKLPLERGDKHTLIFSSNRGTSPRSVSSSGDTLMASKGGYDIYQVPVSFSCDPTPSPAPLPPIVEKKDSLKYNLSLINAGDPKQEIKEPIIIVKNLTKHTEEKYTKSSISINLDKNSEYEILGGSNYYIKNCEDLTTNNVEYYKALRKNLLLPIITPRKEIVKYDSLVGQKRYFKLDTIKRQVTIPIDGLATFGEMNKTVRVVDRNHPDAVNSFPTTIENYKVIESMKQSKQKVMSFDCGCYGDDFLIDKTKLQLNSQKTINQKTHNNKDGNKGRFVFERNNELNNTSQDNKGYNKLVDAIDVVMLDITKTEWVEGSIVKKERVVTLYDTTENISDEVIRISGANSRTKLTMLANLVTDNKTQYATIRSDKFKGVLNDTLYLIPVNYYLPPCENIVNSDTPKDLETSVPFFQTAFWEVNTSENLRRHKQELQKDGRLGTERCIELNYAHRDFGYQHKPRREQRVKEYEDYAVIVDKSLNLMATTIIDTFMVALNKVKQVSPKTKLFIAIEAYSDVRGAELCLYKGPDVEFYNIDFTLNAGAPTPLKVKKETIRNRSTLSEDNTNLSLLRAYYGYKELLKLLMKDKEFRKLYNSNKIFDPTISRTEQELAKAFDESDIIVTMYGRGADTEQQFSHNLEYDPVRRLELAISILEYDKQIINKSKCCR